MIIASYMCTRSGKRTRRDWLPIFTNWKVAGGHVRYMLIGTPNVGQTVFGSRTCVGP